jgi:hypothetical protein
MTVRALANRTGFITNTNRRIAKICIFPFISLSKTMYVHLIGVILMRGDVESG